MSRLNFLEAESIALKLAYEQFFGKGNSVGIAFTFIADQKNGNQWTDLEKKIAKHISEECISDLKRINLANLIEANIVSECAMSRRFMATGSGQTSFGYNY